MDEQSMEPIEISDKRLAKRIAKEINISYTTLARMEVEPYEFGNTITTDISSRGLSLVVDEPVEVPTLIQARIQVDSDPRGLIFLGRTVYCQPVDDTDVHRVGVKFIGILPADLRDLLDEIGKAGDNGSDEGTSL